LSHLRNLLVAATQAFSPHPVLPWAGSDQSPRNLRHPGVEALHDDAFGLADEIAASQRAAKLFTPPHAVSGNCRMGSQHVADFLGGSAEGVRALGVDIERALPSEVKSRNDRTGRIGVCAARRAGSEANFGQRFSFPSPLGTVRLVCVTRAKPLAALNRRERCSHNAFRNPRP
jgi:hypothetical protein